MEPSHVAGRTDIRLFLSALLLLLLAAAGALFLFWVGIDALEGRNHFQFFADSETYHAAARGDLIGLDGPGDFIGIAGNFLGPVLLLKLVGDNYYLVMLVNVGLLFVSTKSIARTLHLDVLRFVLLLLINPLTISSVLSVNKEIISLLFLALFLRAYVSRSVLIFGCAVLVSVLVRWQLALFVMAFAFIVSPLNPLRHRRGAVLSVLLLGMSVLYVALASVFESIRYNIEMSAGDYQGSGLFELLTNLQEKGAYFLVFPIKAAHLLFGMGLRFDRLLAPADIYNDVWQLLHSTMTLVIFVAIWRKKRFHLRNDLIYVSIIYLAIFAISPIYSPRYFYPIYVLWVAVLVSPTSTVRFLRGGVRRLPAAAAAEQAVADGEPQGST